MDKIELYDTTLRDGAQYEGISFSVEDKLSITETLDDLGVHYVEGGWPGSNPKDALFFERVRELKLKNTTVTAFGSTRRANVDAANDPQIQALLSAKTEVITLVGKTWDLHVTHVLETSLEENLGMVSDSIDHILSEGRRVFFDAEHFFDGYKQNREYALKVVQAAAKSGAECIVLCDTNGGASPTEIVSAVKSVKSLIDTKIGIHTHNDSDMAVAASISAIDAGVVQVQGTINGYGERCGNANLISLIANLKLKKNIDCISDTNIKKLTSVSRFVSEVANMPPPSNQAFVGTSAFTHKGGLHAAAVDKVEHSYQHIPPSVVGNTNRVLVSELSGRSNVLMKAEERMNIKLSPDLARELVNVIKDKESRGFQYEGAEASFELIVRRAMPDYVPPFGLVDFMPIVEKRADDSQDEDLTSQVMVKVVVGDKEVHTAATGNGPVNALDHALRKALLGYYPELQNVSLTDYKVRVVDQQIGTDAVVRVLIESTDGENTWSTVGSSQNIIEASWMALVDSVEWWLLTHSKAFS